MFAVQTVGPNPPAYPCLDLGLITDPLSYQMPLLDARRAGAELYGAPRLSAFDLFAPNENTLSRIIADLFDPCGSHGQGVLFLNALLAALNLPRVGLRDSVHVRREAPTDARRRIDLVIETPHLILGIENKPWAAQQHHQLQDYLDELRRWSGHRRVALVFLSNQEAQTARADVIRVPYLADGASASLRQILVGCASSIRAVRTKLHVDEFVRYIDAQFGKGPVMEENDRPYVQAAQVEFAGGANKRKAVAAILLSQSTLHAQILDEITAFILDELRRIHPDFEPADARPASEILASPNSGWFFVRPSWPANCSVGLECESGGFVGIFYGVKAPDPASDKVSSASGWACPARREVENAVRGIGGGRRTAWWPWWQYTSSRSWGPEFAARLVIESPTGAVDQHPFIQDLARRLIGIAVAVDVVAHAGNGRPDISKGIDTE